MANNKGKEFEEQFKKYAPRNCSFIYRLRDAGYTGDATSRRFTITNICDFIAYSNQDNSLLLLELKHFKGASISLNNIKLKHAEKMVEHAKEEGVKAFHVFESERYGRVWAVPSETIVSKFELMKMGGPKSINAKVLEAEGIEIPSYLLKTKYRYDWSHIF